MEFDSANGLLRCEAGVGFDAILRAFAPQGFFLPVLPGTKFITLGGAIANDIHGKNHHRAGTFGRYVRRFELLRSDGRLICSPAENSNLFHATIGGLGLTGAITWAEIELSRVAGESIRVETTPFDTLDEFIALCAESESHEHTVAWIDSWKERGIFMRGDHVYGRTSGKSGGMTIPCDAPEWLISNPTMRAFNSTYFRVHAHSKKVIPYEKFFFPLDAIGGWNRLYGRRGFLQYQCTVPADRIHDIFSIMERNTIHSTLVVGKTFGNLVSPGMMSFPAPGVTLAMDFPNLGEKLFRMLDEFDAIVDRVYPAKDARMSREAFARFYPQWREFARFIDSRFSSSFWRRVAA